MVKNDSTQFYFNFLIGTETSCLIGSYEKTNLIGYQKKAKDY